MAARLILIYVTCGVGKVTLKSWVLANLVGVDEIALSIKDEERLRSQFKGVNCCKFSCIAPEGIPRRKRQPTRPSYG